MFLTCGSTTGLTAAATFTIFVTWWDEVRRGKAALKHDILEYGVESILRKEEEIFSQPWRIFFFLFFSVR